MITSYLAPFVIAALISGGLTYCVILIARKFNWADFPAPRKIHHKPMPRLGGVAMILTFLSLAVGYSIVSERLRFSPTAIFFLDKRLVGVILGTLVLLGVGIIDDLKGLTPWKKLIGHFLAAIVVVGFGLSIDFIRLPGGHHLELNTLIFPITLFHHAFHISLWGDLLTILWIVILINTMNFLDGLDGLAAGVGTICGIAIFFLSISLNQPAVALLALIFAGSVFGFLPWNFNPAKIFMGDSGSMFLGYLLAILSVISGGKLATAFLILGLPVLDGLWVIIRRIINRKSPFRADKLHLHHRLLALGLSQRQVVIVLYLVAALFGIIAVLAGTEAKINAFYSLLIIMSALVIALIVLEWKKRGKKQAHVL